MAPFNANDIAPERVVTINGERVVVPAGDFLAFLKAATTQRGITTFAAYVNGRELNSLSEISDEFEDGNVIEVKTYAKPGLV